MNRLLFAPLLFSAYLGHSHAENSQLDKVVVTATGEAKSLSELAQSVGLFSSQQIQDVSPAHPSEILNRTAGVYINNLGGEGHMTAIRQPITTSGVYLYLEDGIPTRPTGFFNHNALYEVNVSQSEKLEVTKGPGSALYGSDAIGGVINSISAKVPKTSQVNINSEAGAYGWSRILFSTGKPLTGLQNSGVGLQINLTHNDGFRDDAQYDRGSLNSRFDYQLNKNLSVKNTVSFTKVEQSGVSGLEYDDFKNNVEKNTFQGDVGGRDIQAIRASSQWLFQTGSDSQLTMTPFYRNNESSMMPSWMVTYDPNERETQFESYGLLSKWRTNFNNIAAQLIVGMDVDHTPSEYQEFVVDMIKDGDFYTGFDRTGEITYDYDATQTSISPYLHFEKQLSEKILMNSGLRYDVFKVDYTDNLAGTAVNTSKLRPDSQTKDYEHLSPKLGLVYQLSNQHDIYTNYRHAFRAPSVSQLFRSGKSTNSSELKPVKSDSFEIGLRGLSTSGLAYEIAIYHMEKTDDIVSVNNSDSDRVSLNAGETTHRGIELSLAGNLSEEFSFATSGSYTEQTYDDFAYLFSCFTCTPVVRNQEINFSGNDVGKAPKTLANISLKYEPISISKLFIEIELEHVGDYYTDETNENDYSGHELINLRSQFEVNDQVQLYARLQNLTDKRYSTYTSNQVGDSDLSYRPGTPLSAFAGVRARF